jgi:hypothetical protein
MSLDRMLHFALVNTDRFTTAMVETLTVVAVAAMET